MTRTAIRKSPATPLPTTYGTFLTDLKSRIRAAQVKASLAVNRELIELYWSIGRDIVQRQESEGWGKAMLNSSRTTSRPTCRVSVASLRRISGRCVSSTSLGPETSQNSHHP